MELTNTILRLFPKLNDAISKDGVNILENSQQITIPEGTTLFHQGNGFFIGKLTPEIGIPTKFILVFYKHVQEIFKSLFRYIEGIIYKLDIFDRVDLA